MELKENSVYNLAELAAWFGVRHETMTRQKDKYLGYLKLFADYEPVGKTRVRITKVIEPSFNKERISNYNKVKEKIGDYWQEDGLDTCSHVTSVIAKEENLPMAESTIYNYVLKSKTELYGKPYIVRGTKGTCVYMWCKKIGTGADAHFEFLTPEEEAVKRAIVSKYYGDTTEQNIFVQGMVRSGEITKEEAWEVLEKLTGLDNEEKFWGFFQELEAELSCTIVRGTLIKPDELVSDAGERLKLEPSK